MPFLTFVILDSFLFLHPHTQFTSNSFLYLPIHVFHPTTSTTSTGTIISHLNFHNDFLIGFIFLIYFLCKKKIEVYFTYNEMQRSWILKKVSVNINNTPIKTDNISTTFSSLFTRKSPHVHPVHQTPPLIGSHHSTFYHHAFVFPVSKLRIKLNHTACILSYLCSLILMFLRFIHVVLCLLLISD